MWAPVKSKSTQETMSEQQDQEVKDALKRPLDDSSGPASKRAHVEGDDDTVQVKVLIPSAAVGAIIGKGGETMRNLKNDSKCRVQMSKNQEVYPGTNERICLVKGKVSQVMMVIEALTEKIKEKVEGVTRDPFDHKDVPRANEVKLLMPNTSAGMVIGKAGASIREIREGVGCQIQVFPKAGSVEAKNSLERVVTVAHEDLDKLISAVQKVLEKVAADPMHAQAVDSKDHENFGQVSGGSAFSGGNSSFGSSNFGTNKFSNGNSGGGFNQFNPMQGLGNNELLQFLDSLQNTLRSSGFNEAAVAEVMQAMQVLAKYNIMGLGLGLGVAAMAQMRSGDAGGGFVQQNQFGSTQNLDTSYGSSINVRQNSNFSSQNSSLQSGANAGGQCWGYSASQISQQPQAAVQNNLNNVLARLNQIEPGGYAASVIVERTSTEENRIDLEVPDAVAGAVVGTKARTLIEIQQHSGCKIVVHKRDDDTVTVPEGSRLIRI